MDRETLINVEGVSCYYADHCAVDDISFAVNRGEVLGFLGPNGAGKSTTMQIICGVIAASSGRVTVAGHDIVEDAIAAKRHIGFLPEHPPLYRDLSVDEYLRYCARLRGVASRRLDELIAETRLRCGLKDQGPRLIGHLSKGYQQRVGIAQAIVHSPAVLILDEPTSGLDPLQIMEIRELINELGEDHSVIVSTHILPEVQTNCHRVLIINRGKLILDEDIQALREDDKRACFTAAFRRPPLLEEIENIEGVTQASCIDRFRFRISYAGAGTPALPETLVAMAAAKDWGLFELVPEYNSLEQTFIHLTRGEFDNPEREHSP